MATSAASITHPAAGTAADTAAGDRKSYLDVWRAAALVRVVVYHVFGWAWLTILFPAMGLMFALAGSLMAASLDRTGPAAVRRRLRRLLPPVWVFGAVSVALMLATGWRTAPPTVLGWGELLWWLLPARTPPVGSQPWAWAHNAVLWYIVTYLWFVLLSPAALRMFRRWPWRSLAVTIAAPVAFRFDLISVGGYFHEQVANLTGYAACWLLGFAHHDGLLRTAPARFYAWATATLAATGAGWVLLAGLTGDTFDLNRIPGGNTLWSAAFVAAVLRFQPQLGWLTRRRPVHRVVAALNARAVSVYLWHLPAGALAATLLTAVAVPGGLPGIAVRLTGVLLLTAGAVALFGWIEDIAARRPPTLIPRHPPARPTPPTPTGDTAGPSRRRARPAPRPPARRSRCSVSGCWCGWSVTGSRSWGGCAGCRRSGSSRWWGRTTRTGYFRWSCWPSPRRSSSPSSRRRPPAVTSGAGGWRPGRSGVPGRRCCARRGVSRCGGCWPRSPGGRPGSAPTTC